jgi:hypothetical protein
MSPIRTNREPSGIVILTVVFVLAIIGISAGYMDRIETCEEEKSALLKRLSEQAAEVGGILSDRHGALTACQETCLSALDYSVLGGKRVSYTCMNPYCDSGNRTNGYECQFSCDLMELDENLRPLKRRRTVNR